MSQPYNVTIWTSASIVIILSLCVFKIFQAPGYTLNERVMSQYANSRLVRTAMEKLTIEIDFLIF